MRKPRKPKPATKAPAAGKSGGRGQRRRAPPKKAARSAKPARKRAARAPRKKATAPGPELAPPQDAATTSPPAGWSQLLTAATPDESELLARLASRATGRVEDVVELVDLAETDAERLQLAELVNRIDRQQANADAGDRHRERTRRRQRELSAAAREIGPLPDVAQPDRRAACARNLQLFLETYYPGIFCDPWTEQQLFTIKRIEVAVLNGGCFAIALERGGGKTSICMGALAWAALYGHHAFILIVGATDVIAGELLSDFKLDIETNDQLAADFPEVCYPIRRLDGIVQRAAGQTLNGLNTRIRWRGKRLVFPIVPGAAASGCVIAAAGITSAVRGARHTTPDGRVLRPGMVFADDPQTDESARSVDQCNTREKIITASLLGLAGPGQKISCVVACTVIEHGDVADRLTDREKNAEFRGKRFGLLASWPANMDLWERYSEIRRAALQSDRDIDEDEAEEDPAPEATAFYLANREAMDAGAVVTAPHRKRPWEVSALQHAIHLFFRNEAVFWSEYMNDPRDPSALDESFPTAAQIAVKLSGYARRVVPPAVQWITVSIDCQARLLYWRIKAYESNFTNYTIDYGEFPEQRRAVFYATRAKPTLRQTFKGQSAEGALYAGIQHVINQLMTARFQREGDGAELAVAFGLIDAGYSSDIVRKAIAESQHRPRLLPAFGRSIDCNEVPISQYRQRPGERIGDEWMIASPTKKGRGIPHVLFDANHWWTHCQRRLATPRGEPGSHTLYGKDGTRVRHDFLARHQAAHFGATVEGKRRKMIVWKMRPGESEDHWGDTDSMCDVAASMLGARVAGQSTAQLRKPKKKRKVRF